MQQNFVGRISKEVGNAVFLEIVQNWAKKFHEATFLKFRRHKRLAQINFRKILRVKTTLTSLNWTLIPQWVALFHETLYTCEEKREAVSSVSAVLVRMKSHWIVLSKNLFHWQTKKANSNIRDNQNETMGSGCGRVDSAVASNIRGPGFESSHRKLILKNYSLFKEKTKINKRGREWPILKNMAKPIFN